MKNLIVFTLLLTACGGSLSDEQRKEMRSARSSQVIQKVSEAELLEQAFAKGRTVVQILESDLLTQAQLDSLAKVHQVRIHWLKPGSPDASVIEQQLIEAYIVSAATGNEQLDNVQRAGTDSLIYTKPLAETLPDGAVSIKGTWNIWMARKDVVLSMQKKK